MIAMMERTAAMLVYPLLGEGEATVGFEVCVEQFERGVLESIHVTRSDVSPVVHQHVDQCGRRRQRTR